MLPINLRPKVLILPCNVYLEQEPVTVKHLLNFALIAFLCACGGTQPSAPSIAGGCGDGIVSEGEACDDGNESDEDQCTSSCQVARCGDGFLQAGEDCDDSNDQVGDGCSDTCQNERCGDGVVSSNEACDDGNDSDVDGCLNNCEVARCGDGVTRTVGATDELEGCDDGDDLDPADGCHDCEEARCGDGVRQGEEACDDGNDADEDACTNMCAEATCGDGVLRTDLREDAPGYEACDDGNNQDRDGCRRDCQTARCGDGVHRNDLAPGEDGAEECDDGNEEVGDGCTADCLAEICGNGRLDAGETDCDDGNDVDTDACRNDCTWARCGDGVVRLDENEEGAALEACDDGNDNPQDACLNDCQFARCGDGLQRMDLAPGEPGYEACDDGNAIDGDLCRADCSGEGLVRASCQAHLDVQPEAPSGNYRIDTGDGGSAILVRCVMEDEIGWIELGLEDAEGILVASAAANNPWHKCADDAGRFYPLEEDEIATDFNGSNRRHLVIPRYLNPATEELIAFEDMHRLRLLVQEIHPETRLVATTADDDNRDLAGGQAQGHEVYIRSSGEEEWFNLTRGTNGECGGAVGSWPAEDSETAFYVWSHDAQQSEHRGDTGAALFQRDLGSLPAHLILPGQIALDVFTGGGVSMGYEQRWFRVR